MRFFHLIPILVASVAVGCASFKPSWTTDLQRAESFAPHAALRIDGSPVEPYFKRRTAVIISETPVTRAETIGSTCAIEALKGHPLTVGQAFAIAHDGYFLTAAHCIDRPLSHLIYSDGKETKVGVPRIVARERDQKFRVDYAILHVDDILPDIFTWASDDELQPASPIIGIGLRNLELLDNDWMRLERTCMAGSFLSDEPGPVGSRRLRTTMPSRDGDSGGPVTLESGKLIGLFYAAQGALISRDTAWLCRPDILAIDQTIANDRAKSHGPTEKISTARIDRKGTAGLVVDLD